MPPPKIEEVDFIFGRTRLIAIVGDPIEQVRSPEMVTAELHKRGHDAICIPLHIAPGDFAQVYPALMKLKNVDGLLVTIPYKISARDFADEVGPQARIVGAINAMARGPDGRWKAEAFDGIGCVEAHRRRGFSFAGKRVMLVGAGGAGSSIGVAIAFEKPQSMRLWDLDQTRVRALADKVKGINEDIAVTIGPPVTEGIDHFLNASPTGMLDDPRMPIEAERLPKEVVFFDAIVKPDFTRLLKLAESCGCRTVYGREMMLGQISKIVDYFGFPAKVAALGKA
jgi:shikimate dehydrogenase